MNGMEAPPFIRLITVIPAYYDMRMVMKIR